MALHTVLGAGAPSWPQTVGDDGDPEITLCSMFYLTTHTGWSCVGGRVYIPNDSRVNNQTIAIVAFSTPGTPVDLSATADRALGTTTPPAGGWVEVEWDTPLPMEPGTWIGIAYQFLDVPDLYIFSGVADVGTGFVQASDGSTLYLAETAIDGGRSRFRIGTDATGASSLWYGTDIVVDDGATANQGDATGSWQFTGTAAGQQDTSGAAAAGYSFAGAATGQREAAGSASGEWAFAGVAASADVSLGSGTGAFEFGGAATGEHDSVGTATGAHAWTADADGARMSQGAAEGTWSFDSVATSGEVNDGDATGAWSFTGTATGSRTTRGLTPTVRILQTLRDILDSLTVGVCPIHPQPCRTVLSPGLNIAWDACGSGCEDQKDGQLWANITTMTSETDGGNCERIIWTADVGIVRCAATLDNEGNPPPVSAEEHDAWQQAADSDSIRKAIRCCDGSDSIHDVELVTWTALGPDGGCVGGAWTIRGVLEDCSNCWPVPQFPRERGC